jgi:hypothetical protein
MKKHVKNKCVGVFTSFEDQCHEPLVQIAGIEAEI